MKNLLFLITLSICSNSLFAQDTIYTTSIGFITSLEIQYNTSNNTEKNISPAATIGFEYGEHKSQYGYRAGIYYTRLNDQDILPYLDYNGPTIDQIYPSPARLETLDFFLSGQIFYYNEEKMRLYGNLGLINSLSFYNNNDYELFTKRYESPNQSLSIRTLIGGGVMFPIKERLGLDISASRKILLHTFDDHFIQPYDGFSFQVKLEYFF